MLHQVVLKSTSHSASMITNRPISGYESFQVCGNRTMTWTAFAQHVTLSAICTSHSYIYQRDCCTRTVTDNIHLHHVQQLNSISVVILCNKIEYGNVQLPYAKEIKEKLKSLGKKALKLTTFFTPASATSEDLEQPSKSMKDEEVETDYSTQLRSSLKVWEEVDQDVTLSGKARKDARSMPDRPRRFVIKHG